MGAVIRFRSLVLRGDIIVFSVFEFGEEGGGMGRGEEGEDGCGWVEVILTYVGREYTTADLSTLVPLDFRVI